MGWSAWREKKRIKSQIFTDVEPIYEIALARIRKRNLYMKPPNLVCFDGEIVDTRNIRD